jgi:glycosyltransferase involved in cell wall biosynthesis
MKILYYTHSWYPIITGITIRYKHFIDNLKKDNEIVLITPYKDSPKYPGITTYHVDSMSIPDISFKDNVRDIKVANMYNYHDIILQIIDICVKHNIEIIHLSCPDPIQVPLYYVSKILNIPVIFMYHTNLNDYCSTYNTLNFKHFGFIPSDITSLVTDISKNISIILPFLAQNIVNIISNPDLIILPSNTYKEQFVDMNICDTSIIKILPIYIDTSVFYPSEQTKINMWTANKTRLLYVGRVELEKNIEEILEIMDKRMSLCIVGKGNDVSRLQKMAKDKNIDVRFIGFVDHHQLRYWYSSADIVVMPSKTETLGFTTLEAIACKAIVVARNEGGTRDVISHKQNGFLYNDAQELKMHIQFIMSNKFDRQKMENNCLDYNKKHNIRNAMKWLERQYKTLIDNK